MSESLFNADTFLAQTVTGALDTKYPLIPAGEYAAIVKKIEAREMNNAKDPAKPFTVLDITYDLDDPALKEELNLDILTCRQSVFLDLHEGQLDMRANKNIQLGRLRESLGLNDPDVAFSFDSLVGQACMVRVEHTPNKNDPESPYANVTKVASL